MFTSVFGRMTRRRESHSEKASTPKDVMGAVMFIESMASQLWKQFEGRDVNEDPKVTCLIAFTP